MNVCASSLSSRRLCVMGCDMGVGIGLIVASVLCFSVTLILAVIAFEVWDSGYDYITDKVLAVAVGMAALSLFLLGLGLIIDGVGRVVGY